MDFKSASNVALDYQKRSLGGSCWFEKYDSEVGTYFKIFEKIMISVFFKGLIHNRPLIFHYASEEQ